MPKAKVYRTKPGYLDYSDPEVKKCLTAAITAFENGEMDIKTASQSFNIKYGTLRNRIQKSAQSYKEAHPKQQLLTPEQEDVLVEWIKFLGLIGRPVSKTTIRPKVKELSGLDRLPGKNWLARFQARHPELKLRRGSGLDPKRAKAFNFQSVNDYFNQLQKILKEKKIPWENVYNMDEKGIQLGGGRRGSNNKYLYSRKDRAQYRLRDGNLELVTVIESCCADGTAFLPGFIFQGTTIDDENMDVHPDICCGTSENGWTSDSLCAQWFEKSFIPQAKERNSSNCLILLIFDGHGSHITDQMLELAVTNGIELLCLPPHTTHKLQPLDVGVLGPLQRKWSEQVDEYVAREGVGTRREHVVQEYMVARNKAFQETTILEAWRRSGIRPLNLNIFTEADFAPSVNMSVVAQLPASYPTEPPSDFDIPNDIVEENEDSQQQFQPVLEFEILSPSYFADLDWSDDEDESEEELEGSALGCPSDNENETEKEEEEEGDTTESEDDTEEGERRMDDFDEEQGRELQSNHMGFGQQLPRPESTPLHMTPTRDRSRSPTPPQCNSTGSSIFRSVTSSQSNPNSRPASRLSTPSAQSTHSRSSSSFSIASAELDDLLQPVSQKASKESLRERVLWLQGALITTRAQRNQAQSHAVLLSSEYAVVKNQLNSKGKKKKRKGVRTQCELITGSESMERRAAQNTEEQAKRQKAADAAVKKMQKQADLEACRVQTGFTFNGTLKSQLKDDLQAIARLLGLPDKGTKDDLVKRIHARFSQDEETFKADPRFSGLFGGRCGCRVVSENTPLPPGPRMHPESPFPSSLASAQATSTPGAGPSRAHFHSPPISYPPYPLPQPSNLNHLPFPTSSYQPLSQPSPHAYSRQFGSYVPSSSYHFP